MDSNKYVAHCGLYCRLCDAIARIPPQSKALLETLKRGGWKDFGEKLFPDFEAFWSVLEKLGRFDETMKACTGGCGDPSCKIRVCASGRGIAVCSSCPDYPCDLIEEFAEKYPIILDFGRDQQEIGLEAWIQKQEELCRSGFAYGDIFFEGKEDRD